MRWCLAAVVFHTSLTAVLAEWAAAAVVHDAPGGPTVCAIPDLWLDPGVSAPLFTPNNNETLYVGATALASDGGSWLWFTTPTCLLRARLHAPDTIALMAGSCTETAARRDGPPRFARFGSIVALSVDPNGYFALWDAAYAQVVVGTPWAVRGYPQDEEGPLLDLALLGYTDLLLLFQANLVVTMRCQDEEGSCLHDPIGWTQGVVSVPVEDFLVSVALASDRKAWFLSRNGTLYCAALPSLRTAVRFPSSSFTDYDQVRAAAGALVLIDRRNERWMSRPPPLDPCSCPPGVLWPPNCTTPAPPGGYAAAEGGRFVPCPNGTFNAEPGGAGPDACLPCPPGTIAPSAGAVACAACPPWAPLPYRRTQCLASYPANHTPCPPMTFVAVEEDGCRPCPPNTVSAAGATACVPVNSQAACYPTGDASLFYEPAAMPTHVFALRLPTTLVAATSLAAARNGTVWVGSFQGIVAYQPIAPDQDVFARSFVPLLSVETPALVTAMAISADEAWLWGATANGSLWRLHGLGAYAELAVVDAGLAGHLCTAPPRPGAAEWLFWIDHGKLLTLYDDAPLPQTVGLDPTLRSDVLSYPGVLLAIASDNPTTRGGLLAMMLLPDGTHALWRFDPLLGVFLPFLSVAPPAGIPTAMRRFGPDGTAVLLDAAVLHWLPDDDHRPQAWNLTATLFLAGHPKTQSSRKRCSN